jgi:hypothetical protein
MPESKTFFEQIPLETVKRIAKDFSKEDTIKSDGENTQTLDEVRFPCENWREVAQRILQERDSARTFELAKQLVDTLDRELYKSVARKRDDGNRSE